MQRLDSPNGYTLAIHSTRKRLCDIDGISAKAAIDGLVACGLLEDDSPKQVKKVEFTQSRCLDGQAEQTTLTFKEVQE